MKKILTILLFCLLCFGLTACDPSHYNQNYNELAANVVRVELINYDGSEAKIINTFTSQKEVLAFDFDKAEAIEALDEESLDDFLRDWSEIGLWNIWSHSNSPAGISLRFVYDNGDFDVFSCYKDDENRFDFGHRFDEKGKLQKYVGLVEQRNDFVEIVNEFFDGVGQ